VLKRVRYGEVEIGYEGPKPLTFAFAALLAGFGAVVGALSIVRFEKVLRSFGLIDKLREKYILKWV